MSLWDRLWGDTPTSSRKFVDLIFKSSSKWPVWDPPVDRIQVGDYGALDKDSGKFEYRDNIYRNPNLAHLVKGHELPHDPPISEEVISITSINARKTEASFGIDADAQLAKAKFKFGWVFGNKPGAVLAAYKPVQTALPHDMDLTVLTNHEDLRDMSLVTKVTTCPAYALYLATNDDRGISLALCVETPLSNAPVAVGPEISTKWRVDCGAGFYREGNKTDQNSFTVLFDLKRCKLKEEKWTFRDSQAPQPTGLDRLEDQRPPWDLLDDDGVEEPPVIYQPWTNEEEQSDED